jgi:hypothetical protein
MEVERSGGSADAELSPMVSLFSLEGEWEWALVESRRVSSVGTVGSQRVLALRVLRAWELG